MPCLNRVNAGSSGLLKSWFLRGNLHVSYGFKTFEKITEFVLGMAKISPIKQQQKWDKSHDYNKVNYKVT